MTERTVTASITRPNLGSLAYVWIDNKEHVASNTKDAWDIMRKRGEVRFIERRGKTEFYEIDLRGRS